MDIAKLSAVVLSFSAVVVVIGVLSWAAIKGSRALTERGKNKLNELVGSLGVQYEPQADLIEVNFPVYIGTVFYVVEFQPQIYVERSKSRKTINSLAVFSLKYGLLTGLAPYVLFMVLLNYLLNIPKLFRG